MNGIIFPEQWIICTRCAKMTHVLVVFQPLDDSQKCPTEDCEIENSKLCLFHYLPLAKVFTSFFQSQVFRHEILQVWWNQSIWLP